MASAGPSAEVLYEDVLPGGSHWSFVANPGVQLQLVDVEGGGNAAMLAYNPGNPLERLNLPRYAQVPAHVPADTGPLPVLGHGAASSVRSSTTTWAGTIPRAVPATRTSCAASGARCPTRKRATRTTATAGNASWWNSASTDSGAGDFAANVNWFSRVDAAADGTMTFVPDHSSAGDTVTLRFEMPTLVVLHTCPHPLNAAPEYPRRPIGYRLSRAEPVVENDPCRISREENGRGFMNNYLYSLGT